MSGQKKNKSTSMLTERQTDSETTGSAKGSDVSTGSPHGEIGYAERKTLPRPSTEGNPLVRHDPVDELPWLIRPIVTEPTARLISYLRFGQAKWSLPSKSRPKAYQLLKDLDDAVETWRRPADAQQVLDALEMMANTIQTELPEEQGLVAYIALLEGLPATVLTASCIGVMRTHTYRTMPLPGEILGQREAERWEQNYNHIKQIIKICTRKLDSFTRMEKQNG